MTVSPFVWDDVTFFTGNALRTASLMWDSHMPHIIPSTFKQILTIFFFSFRFSVSPKVPPNQL
jgi:hypothetical protein